MMIRVYNKTAQYMSESLMIVLFFAVQYDANLLTFHTHVHVNAFVKHSR